MNKRRKKRNKIRKVKKKAMIQKKREEKGRKGKKREEKGERMATSIPRVAAETFPLMYRKDNPLATRPTERPTNPAPNISSSFS